MLTRFRYRLVSQPLGTPPPTREALLTPRSKIRTIEMDGKRIKLQIVRTPDLAPSRHTFTTLPYYSAWFGS